MTTVLIIVCIVACAAVILAVLGFLGFGIAEDKTWRARIRRHHATRGRHSRLSP
jgi:ABC-type dipeptide/oligopeptide/nickel transport system permease subunit